MTRNPPLAPKRLALLLLVLAAGVPGLPAQAQSPADRMFPGGEACYLRSYSRNHLASHPDQRSREIALGPWAPGRGDPRSLVLKLQLWLRDAAAPVWGVAFCENTGGSLSCGLEGDAGHFTLTPQEDGRIRLEVGRHGLLFEGADEIIEISGTTGDDRTFLMPRVPADSCP